MTTDNDYDAQELQAFQEYKDSLTCFGTKAKFVEFSTTNWCIYPAGFGGYVEGLVETEEQFFAFIQKAYATKAYSPDYEYSAAGINWFFEKEHIVFDGWDESDDEYPDLPTEVIMGYKVDYCEYSTKPFQVQKCRVEIISDFTNVHMSENLKAQLPFIARFCDVDTYDRCGSVQGTIFNVLSLKEYSPGTMFFH
jgi:hypothetical protein